MGLRPARMANSDIRIRLQRRGAEQPVDPVFGNKIRPLDEQHEAEMTIRGQPRFRKNKELTPRTTGDSETTLGYITVARDELERRGITNPDSLKHARITGFFRRGAWQNEDFVIVRVDHRGHLMNGPILVKLYFNKHKDAVGSR